ncbi:hypothetical protein JRQ81_014465 [Phrynocephalus forsythii]|uniref:Uncharacterized protein n=1 Tax=Phrynocephalus forsythii TaxID=171643 RepID=A0A9Q0XXT4_9SAUR|nr:hypothetical protein JRQ81_014465 [Phrynocephalus forsythii]
MELNLATNPDANSAHRSTLATQSQDPKMSHTISTATSPAPQSICDSTRDHTK